MSSSSTLTTLTATPCLLLWADNLLYADVCLLCCILVHSVSCVVAQWNAVGYACRREAQTSEQVRMIIQNCTDFISKCNKVYFDCQNPCVRYNKIYLSFFQKYNMYFFFTHGCIVFIWLCCVLIVALIVFLVVPGVISCGTHAQ